VRYFDTLLYGVNAADPAMLAEDAAGRMSAGNIPALPGV